MSAIAAIHIFSPAGPFSSSVRRAREPITLGIPLAPGVLTEAHAVALTDPGGRPCAVQTRILDRWSDRSIRWMLVDFQADHEGRESIYHLHSATDASAVMPERAVHVSEHDGQIVI